MWRVDPLGGDPAGKRIPINREPDPVRGNLRKVQPDETLPARAQVLPTRRPRPRGRPVSSCGSRTSRRARMLTGIGVTDSLSLRRPRRPGGMLGGSSPRTLRAVGRPGNWPAEGVDTPTRHAYISHVGQTPGSRSRRHDQAPVLTDATDALRATLADPTADTDCPRLRRLRIEWPKMRHACDRCGGLGVIPVPDLTDDERDRLLAGLPRSPSDPPRAPGARAEGSPRPRPARP